MKSSDTIKKLKRKRKKLIEEKWSGVNGCISDGVNESRKGKVEAN